MKPFLKEIILFQLVVEIEENEKVVQGDRNEEVGLGGGGETSSSSRAIGNEVGERSTTDVEIRSEVQHSIPSAPGFVKTFSIDKFQEAVGDPIGVVGSGFDDSGGGDELDDVAHHSVFENGIDHDDASPSLCATCQCKSCNERRAELVNRIHALTEAVNNLAPKRGINPSKMISNSCIPIEIRKRKTEISKALSTIKVISKVVNPLPRPAVQLELQKGKYLQVPPLELNSAQLFWEMPPSSEKLWLDDKVVPHPSGG
uniref:Uncharacterized protein n=1 Tax=Solanum lycopersicum TaxID=4081 RepID=A0A3Q7IY86_SOLLC